MRSIWKAPRMMMFVGREGDTLDYWQGE